MNSPKDEIERFLNFLTESDVLCIQLEADESVNALDYYIPLALVHLAQPKYLLLPQLRLECRRSQASFHKDTPYV